MIDWIVGVPDARAALRDIIARGSASVDAARLQGLDALDEAVDAASNALSDFTKASMPADSDDPAERAAIDALDQQALAAMQHFQILAITSSVNEITKNNAALTTITSSLQAAAAVNVDTAQRLRLTSLSNTLDGIAAAVASAKALAGKLNANNPDEAEISAATGDLVASFTKLKDLIAQTKV
jgi:hypothetical protein